MRPLQARDADVCGEGPKNAPIMFVGEQPGDQEDLEGKPFIGPAGQILMQALGEAGIDRSDVYITNAVKHFKFKPRGSAVFTKGPIPMKLPCADGGWNSR